MPELLCHAILVLRLVYAGEASLASQNYSKRDLGIPGAAAAWPNITGTASGGPGVGAATAVRQCIVLLPTPGPGQGTPSQCPSHQ